MKKIILTILCLTVFLNINAQFDDKFYFPSKEWKTFDHLQYDEIDFIIDNDTLNTILFKTDASPKATIIFYHGGGGNISFNTDFAEVFVEQGYQVYMIDFRAYGKSTGTPTHLNIAKDAQIIFDSLILLKTINQYPIIIYGASMGTQIATKMAKDNQTKICGLVLDGAISSFTDLALMSAAENQKTIISQYVTSPYSAKEDVKEITSIPILMIHSKKDKTIPFSQAEIVFSNASEPKEMWIYKGEHLEAIVKHKQTLIEKIENLCL